MKILVLILSVVVSIIPSIKDSKYEEYGVRKLCKSVRKEIENEIICEVFS